MLTIVFHDVIRILVPKIWGKTSVAPVDNRYGLFVAPVVLFAQKYKYKTPVAPIKNRNSRRFII
jgi:hypothetical protein